MSDIITSTQNQWVKLAHNLQRRAKLRRQERKIVLEGTRLIQDALAVGYRPQYVLYDQETADYHLIAQLQEQNVKLHMTNAEIIAHVSDTQQPQGLIAVFGMPMPKLPDDPQRIVILDAIREPGNMGTILRTAGAAGVQLVLLAPGCVDPYNPKVVRSAMGAHFRVPLIEPTWGEMATYTQPLNVYFATGDGDLSYSDVDWTQPWALVIGNEAHGVGKAAQKLSGQTVMIPMAMQTESLNAAVATGVILFEAQRQRLQNA